MPLRLDGGHEDDAVDPSGDEVVQQFLLPLVLPAEGGDEQPGAV